MPSPLAHVVGLLALYVAMPPSCTAFFSSPMRPSLLSCDLQSTTKVRTPVSRRQDAGGACRRETGSLAKRSLRQTGFVLQAATEGDNPVTDQESQQQEQQQQQQAEAAARSKQLNIACNDVVRTILDGNVSDEKAKALALRQRLEKQRDDLVSPDDDMSALFFDNLLLVCQHELHPDIGILRGEYGRAWHTILHYIEDAGWQLTDPPFSISG